MNDLTDDLIYNIVIYADDATLSYECGCLADLWQQLELASELEFDFRDTVEVKWPADFNARKMQLASLDHSNNSRTM